MKLRCVCISDTHNQLQNVPVVEGDVLIHAGDMLGMGTMAELNGQMAILIKRFPHKYIIFIAGNHDRIFEQNPNYARAQVMTWNDRSGGRLYYLQDNFVDIHGVRFYGSPWTPNFYDWAFMPERGSDELKRKWKHIPEDTDVLITHGPPHGILDMTAPASPGSKYTDAQSVGCELLRERLETISPRYHIFGHIHHSYGVFEDKGTTYANVSSCDELYKPTRAPFVFDIEAIDKD